MRGVTNIKGRKYPRIDNVKKTIMGQSSEIIHAILEIAPVGIYIVNKEGRIDYVNSAMVVISGATHEQFTTSNVFELETYQKLGLSNKIKAVFEGESFSINEVEYTSSFSGKTTIRNIMGIPMVEAEEKKALIFVEDITQIKQAEREMERAMAIKSQFISLASHEIRAPLSIISLYIANTVSGMYGELNKQQEESLKGAMRNIERLTRLANDVLSFQKMEEGKMKFDMEEGSLNDICSEAAKEIEPFAAEKNIKIVLSLSNTLPLALFDKDKIMQVVINLINNAIKYTDEGTIELKSNSEDKMVKVSIIDTGIGIKEKDLNKLFLGFSQVHDTRERSVGGTGLGLAISKQIVEGHKGKIEVESEYGKGSIFSFYLPLTPPQYPFYRGWGSWPHQCR